MVKIKMVLQQLWSSWLHKTASLNQSNFHFWHWFVFLSFSGSIHLPTLPLCLPLPRTWGWRGLVTVSPRAGVRRGPLAPSSHSWSICMLFCLYINPFVSVVASPWCIFLKSISFVSPRRTYDVSVAIQAWTMCVWVSRASVDVGGGDQAEAGHHWLTGSMKIALNVGIWGESYFGHEELPHLRRDIVFMLLRCATTLGYFIFIVVFFLLITYSVHKTIWRMNEV